MLSWKDFNELSLPYQWWYIFGLSSLKCGRLVFCSINLYWYLAGLPATKLLATSSYKLGFYRYGWGSRTFRNITIDSTYILIQGWLSMTQLLLEHSWRSHYNGQGKADDFPLKMKAYLGNSPKHFVVQAGKLLRAPKKPLEMVSLTINTKACNEEYLPT